MSLLRPANLLRVCFLLAIPVLVPETALGQDQDCTNFLGEADAMYAQGDFDGTISLINRCIDDEAISESNRRIAYRLIGLSYIGKGVEGDAKEAVRQLLTLVPNYEPDPVMDPPNFVSMVAEVRQEIGVQAPAEPQQEAPAPAQTPPAQVESTPPSTQVSTPQQPTTTSTRRKKGNGRKILLGGLGAAAAGGLVYLLVSGPSGGDAIAAPPGLPPSN